MGKSETPGDAETPGCLIFPISSGLICPGDNRIKRGSLSFQSPLKVGIRVRVKVRVWLRVMFRLAFSSTDLSPPPASSIIPFVLSSVFKH